MVFMVLVDEQVAFGLMYSAGRLPTGGEGQTWEGLLVCWWPCELSEEGMRGNIQR